MIFHQKENRGIIIFSSFLAFFLLLLAVMMQVTWLPDLDHMIQDLTTITPDSFVAKFFQILTFFGSPVVVLTFSALLIIYFIVQKERVTALWIAFTILAGDMIAFGFKQLARRPRPSEIIGGASGFSFPSGHVFGSTILILFLVVIICPRIAEAQNRFWFQVLLWIWLFLIVISRIYLRSHYPSDVIGSLLLATSWWGFSEFLYLKFYKIANKVLKDNPSIKDTD